MDVSGSGKGPMTGSCQQSNERSDSLKEGGGGGILSD
jgi:hypothetical protein